MNMYWHGGGVGVNPKFSQGCYFLKTGKSVKSGKFVMKKVTTSVFHMSLQDSGGLGPTKPRRTRFNVFPSTWEIKYFFLFSFSF
jgi:hypothetical protein